jgi:hypothetical protein
MTSTSQDLLDWGEAVYSGDLLGADTTATMLEMRNPYLGAIFGLGAMGFCRGLADCTPDEVELVGHSGIGVAEPDFRAVVERLVASSVDFGNDPEEPNNGQSGDPLGGDGASTSSAPMVTSSK